MTDDRACEWYARCTNVATLWVSHPVLSDVPTCDRCADRHELHDRATPINAAARA